MQDLGVDLYKETRLETLGDVLSAAKQKKQLCMEKRWKYTKSNGDVLEKITSWIDKFKKIGDFIVSQDPSGYTALPWMVVGCVLQLTINDCKTFGAIAEGVEYVALLVTRYEITERLYLSGNSRYKVDLAMSGIAESVLWRLPSYLSCRRFSPHHPS